MHLVCVLGNKDPLELKFKIRSTPIAIQWIERLNNRNSYDIDHRGRFYGFGTREQEEEKATLQIKQCIDIINNFETIIDRHFEFTQDCFNYLHNIFERYHGLLDKQATEYWHRAPESVRQALADLNLAVHRCETIARGVKPRFVCTWFGMPKVKRLDLDLQKEFGVPKIEFGTVYLNYCEIGKTLEDLTYDRDTYIGDDAFKPFSHYSADFNVHFYDLDLQPVYGKIQNFIEQRRDFFLDHGIENVYNVKAQPLRFPVADLVYSGSREQLLFEISQRQWVQEVRIE